MLARLHSILSAVCPIVGVSPGSDPPATVRIDYHENATTEQRAAAQAALAAFDWSDAAHAVWLVGQRRQEAGTAAATAGDGTSVANRAAESVGATRDNNLAETLKALCDLLNVTTQQLADRIAANRLVVPPTTLAPTPAETVESATVRLGATEINGLVGAYIALGAGDPIGGE